MNDKSDYERMLLHAIYTSIFKTIVSQQQESHKVSDNVELDKEQLKSLIDVAIDQGDKEWFLELSDRLIAVR